MKCGGFLEFFSCCQKSDIGCDHVTSKFALELDIKGDKSRQGFNDLCVVGLERTQLRMPRFYLASAKGSVRLAEKKILVMFTKHFFNLGTRRQ